MSSKNILVVEDEKRISEVIESYLKNAGYQTTCVFDGKDAVPVFKNGAFSMVLLDLMLPNVNGEMICTEIRKISNVPIIMLTAKVEEVDILKGLDIGADDYITKPFSPKQMVARVNALLRRAEGKNYSASSLLSFNNKHLVIDIESREVKIKDEPISLTPNEYKILITLAKSPNKIFTREALIHAALNDFDGFDRTIDSHIKNLRQKIETDSKNCEFILTVRGAGYKFGGV